MERQNSFIIYGIFSYLLTITLINTGCTRASSVVPDMGEGGLQCQSISGQCSSSTSNGWSTSPQDSITQAFQGLSSGNVSVTNPPASLSRLLNAADLHLADYDSDDDGLLEYDEVAALLNALRQASVLAKIAEAMHKPVQLVSFTANNNSLVNIYNGKTGKLINTVTLFSSFAGLANLAMGDLDNDGIADIVAGAGEGGGPRVRVLSGKNGKELANFFAFESDFRGGVNVAVGDIDGDGQNDIITGAGPGGGPRVIVWSGKDFHPILDFMAGDSNFRGGVSVAVADLNGDRRNDLIVAKGEGGHGQIKIYDHSDNNATPTIVTPFESDFNGQINLAIGDMDHDHLADIIVSAGKNGGPRVIGLKGNQPDTHLFDFFAYDSNSRNGVYIAAGRFQRDPSLFNLITGPGAGLIDAIKVFAPNPQSGILRSFGLGNGTQTGPVAAGDWYGF